MQPKFWDDRYGRQEYIYGVSPNVFFKQFIDKEKPGKVLLPCDGEGRNAVYAASLGWQVDAFDFSLEGRKKALQLAELNKVDIVYSIAKASEYQPKERYYDLIALIFSHLPKDERDILFPNLIKALKPGGHLIAEIFSKDQLKYNSGGPKDPEMLMDPEDMEAYFGELETEMLAKKTILLRESKYHEGEGSVTRFIGRKQ